MRSPGILEPVLPAIPVSLLVLPPVPCHKDENRQHDNQHRRHSLPVLDSGLSLREMGLAPHCTQSQIATPYHGHDDQYHLSGQHNCSEPQSSGEKQPVASMGAAFFFPQARLVLYLCVLRHLSWLSRYAPIGNRITCLLRVLKALPC